MTPDEKKQLRAHFSVAEDYPFACLYSGWTVSVRELLDSGRLAEVVEAVKASGSSSLELALGAFQVGEAEDDRVVLGFCKASSGGVSAELDLELILKTDAACKEVAKLGDRFAPFDVTATPANWMVAQGPLCNAMLVHGAKTEYGKIYDEDDRMRTQMQISGLDYHGSYDMGQEPQGGIYGVVLAKAGPWKNPMTHKIEWSKAKHEASEKKISGAGFRPAYYVMYSYGN